MKNKNRTEFFSYLPGGNQSRGRSLVSGLHRGEPWMLGSDAMFAAGETRRRASIHAARFPEEGLFRAIESRQRATAPVATEPAIDAWRPSDPALLAGMDLGAFQYAAWPGELVLPEVRVNPIQGANGAMTIELPSWGNEHFELYDTQRGMGAGYNVIDTDPTTVTKKLGLYGIAATKDIRIVNKADSFLDISGKHSALALRALMLDRERRVRNLILDTSNYTANHSVTLSTEWDDPGGDAKADFDTRFGFITASSGIPRELFTVTLTSYDSFDAAVNDPTFIAQRTSTLGVSPNTATLQELARYWRVRRVNVADCRANISGTVSSLWGDAAVIHWAGDTAPGVDLANLSLEDFMGTPMVGGVFVGHPGIAKAPYESTDGHRTMWVWPVDGADVPWVTTYNALGLILNVKA